MKSVVVLLIIMTLVSLTFFSVQAQEDPYEVPLGSISDEAAFFMGLGLTMCAIIILIPLIIAILLCIWIYKDAEQRGKSGVLWVLILILGSLFFSFIGLIIIIIIWLAVRPPIGGEQASGSVNRERRCPNCGRVIPNDARVCPYCSKNFQE
jgi:hypothetical protein